MRIIFKFLILFFIYESQCSATSTSFEQNLIFNNNQSFKMNANKSIGNFNTLAVTGSISVIGEKLYNAGLFQIVGSALNICPKSIPKNIKNDYEKRLKELINKSKK